MHTRRTLTGVAKDTLLKPTFPSIFKHSKARTGARTLAAKAVVAAVPTRAIETESQTSILSFKNDTTSATVASTARLASTRRTRKAASLETPLPMETDPANTTALTSATTATLSKATTEKVTKPKAPEVNPWTKRLTHVPPYAEEALAHLCRVDPALELLIAKHPYSIYADHDANYFRVLTRTILGQQIHWKAARSIIHKFVSHYFPDGQVTPESLDAGDKTFPTPQQVLSTSVDTLRQCGLSERKASYIQDLARHFVEDKITFTDKAMLQSMTDEEVAGQLLCVRGIGPWTVDMFMMFSLERLDVLPTLDLGIRKGMEKHFRHEYKNGVWGTILDETEVDEVEGEEGVIAFTKKVVKKKTVAKGKGKGKAKNGEMSCEDMERMAEKWRPYRSIASWYMWRNADAEDVITAPI